MGKYFKFLRQFSQRIHYSTYSNQIRPSAGICKALQNGHPIVALESTIITHGMPYPNNYKMALSVEKLVRENGAIPATIAILNGKIHVGLNESELEHLSQDKNAIKVTKRDIPYALGKLKSGGTTVSATMAIANRVGISVFVTGGIGGVHREVETSMDISSDLTELGKTPIALICAGIKSILDIGKTLEYLETQGVCVVTYGETRDFPAFYTSKSGHLASYNVNSPKEAATLIDQWRQFEMQNGMLFGVPIPEEYSLDGSEIEQSITTAMEDARKLNIRGKDTTPFLLHRVNELTAGRSLQANIALIENNAKIGSQIAFQLSQINGSSNKPENKARKIDTNIHNCQQKSTNSPVVIGGSNVDFVVQVMQDEVKVRPKMH